MLIFRVVTLILLVVGSSYADSEEEESFEDDVLENPDLFHGDIIGIDDLDDRNAVPKAERLWPEGRIPYVVDAGLSSTVRMEMVQKAMWRYGNKTCIRFVPRTTETNYVRIFPGQGCYSAVGRSKSQTIQVISLGRGCGFMGTILHELGHTVGFFHEQSRSDRDDFITIFWENIQPGQLSQFKKLDPEQNQLLTPFDFDSVMLYGSYSFSKDRKNLKTMTGKDGRLIEPTRGKNLSKSDVIRIKKLYKCKKQPKRNDTSLY